MQTALNSAEGLKELLGVLRRLESLEHPFSFPDRPVRVLRPRRHLLPAPTYHQLLQTRFAEWRQVTGLAAA